MDITVLFPPLESIQIMILSSILFIPAAILLKMAGYFVQVVLTGHVGQQEKP